HEGGHIPGAINLNTDEAIERAFLVPESEEAAFAASRFSAPAPSHLPEPSRSGDGKVGKKIIVFHCEFSVKRAPTFAKQFRSKDRAMNNAVYPKIHYPEVYILEGGYSNFYTQFSGLCEGTYVRMDDPAHLRSRATELNDFRRWNRARSFTFGEMQKLTSGSAPGSGRENQRPTGTDSNGLLPAAPIINNARQPKRPPLSTLQTLAEDGDSSFASSEPDIGDSPCPPPAASKLGGGGASKPAKSFAPLTSFSAAIGASVPSLNAAANPRSRGMQRAFTSALVGARH
ncbi:Rhodanese-like protein, partial [Clavulina sp. PMI_390]